MTRQFATAILLAALVVPGAARAQLQYFGYAGSAYTQPQNRGLEDTKSYTNFTTLSTTEFVYDDLQSRAQAAAQRGLKVTIDLGKLLWCPEPGTTDVYRHLCSDYQTRWNNWVQYNQSVLTSAQVVAFAILDEPFLRQADMSHYEAAAALVKSTFWWAKIFMVEAACTVRGCCPGVVCPISTFDNYAGGLPNVDWVGLDEYGIRPATDSGYQSALQELKGKFPGKKTLYVMDGWSSIAYDSTIAREWYNMARYDPNAVLLGVFLWQTSENLPCSVLQEHIAIGRAITGKRRTQSYSPIGYLDGIDSNGVASGWACDPDGAICENVSVRFYASGLPYAYVGITDQGSEEAVNSLCRTGKTHRFRHPLGSETAGRTVTVYADDLDFGSSLIPAHSCAASPSCVWYPNNYQPKGYLDGISSTGYAWGWTCDPDAPNVSTQVEVFANGYSVGVFPADQGSESVVNAECGGGTAHRFGVQLPSWTKGLSILAYGRDTMSGSTNLPGWLCPQSPACVW